MTKEKQITLAKVLLSFALVLILLGIAFHLESQTLINPITNTHVIGKTDTSDINITTTDTPVTSTEEEPAPSTETKNPETGNPNISESPSNSEESNQVTEQPSPPAATPPSIETTNDNLRKSIENTYGITVRYGVETNGYTIAGLSTVRLTDSNRINQLLNELNSNLALYPAGFFNETKQAGYTLTIYLIKQYSQANVTGITDSTTKNILISLATDYSFTESLHHEIYHYIEKYMYAKGANYTTWNTLNPIGFNYGETNNSYSFASTGSPTGSSNTVFTETELSNFSFTVLSVELVCSNSSRTVEFSFSV